MFVSMSIYMSGIYGGCKLFFFKQIKIVKHTDDKLPPNPVRSQKKKQNERKESEIVNSQN